MPVSRAESVGVMTSRDHKTIKFLKFSLDDGTGCISCILWLNHLSSPYFSHRDPGSVALLADVARRFAAEIQIGKVARVRGRIGSYRGGGADYGVRCSDRERPKCGNPALVGLLEVDCKSLL